MKSVLYVVDKMNRGGAETFLMNILRNINKDKYAIYFLCFGNDKFDYQDEIEQLGGKIIRIPRHTNPLRLIREIRQVIRRYGVEVIHAHIQLASMYSIIAGRLERVSTRLTHSHSMSAGRAGGLAYKIYEFVAKKVIGYYSTHLIACGEEAGRYLFSKRPFEVIVNGIVLADFAFSAERRSDFRRQHGFGDDDFLIGMVARLEEVKNHKFAIEVFRRYCERHPKARLVLAGRGSLQRDLERLVEKSGLAERVVFLGLVEDTASLYSGLDLVIMPSLYEGLPVSLVEAQANSLRCLCSDRVDKDSNVGGLVEFLSIDNDPYDEWSAAIAKHSAARREHMPNVIERITENGYNISETVKRLEEIYQ